mmetsp:Transcript_19435/g.47014  ORF Transcript_19435/g.47014 Transcript_19435/m.47014 type:complete len:244 (-) Transcript_19435:650-1381(-)
MMLDEHVAAPRIQLRLPLVLPRHNRIEDVGTARQGQLHRAHLASKVLGKEGLAGAELLQRRVDRGLDARVVLLDRQHFHLRLVQRVHLLVLSADGGHEPHQLFAVALQPLAALALGSSQLHELVLALLVPMREHVLEGGLRGVETPLVREEPVPLRERAVADLVHLAHEELLRVHHNLDVVDLALRPHVHFHLDAHALVEGAGSSHHVRGILRHPLLPLADPPLNIAVSDGIVEHHFRAAICH